MTADLFVLGLAGSPRRGGNTELLLDRFLAGAQGLGAQVEKVVVARLKIAGCIACDGCHEEGRCVVRDDFQALDERIVAADVIALAAPLFFWGLPAAVKALVDRSQCQWARKFVLKYPLPPTVSGRARRRGVFLSVGGEEQADFRGAVRTVRGFFGVHEADYWGELLISGVDRRGAIRDHSTALDDAFRLGERAAQIAEP